MKNRLYRCFLEWNSNEIVQKGEENPAGTSYSGDYRKCQSEQNCIRSAEGSCRSLATKPELVDKSGNYSQAKNEREHSAREGRDFAAL